MFKPTRLIKQVVRPLSVCNQQNCASRLTQPTKLCRGWHNQQKCVSWLAQPTKIVYRPRAQYVMVTNQHDNEHHQTATLVIRAKRRTNTTKQHSNSH
jgi:hypothetical protein